MDDFLTYIFCYTLTRVSCMLFFGLCVVEDFVYKWLKV